MNKQHTTEPNMAELPEVYSTMPNKWEKWTPTNKKEEERKVLKNFRKFFRDLPLGTEFSG